MNFLKCIDESTVDPTWLSEKTGFAVKSATFSHVKKMGGMSAEIKYIDVTIGRDQDQVDEIRMVVKAGGATEQRAKLGIARAVHFYVEIAPTLVNVNIPTCYYAEGSMETGEMLLLLEDVSNSIPSGVFFGSGNPNNWAITEKLPELCEGNPNAIETTIKAFKLFAHMHGQYWMDNTLIEKTWLRASDWMRGENEKSWKEAQAMQSSNWSNIKKQIGNGTATIEWDSHLVACLDVSFQKASEENAFTTYSERMSSNTFTLVQGDCHPHNLLWNKEDRSLHVIDFEMIGVGPPGQELGQFIISHMIPSVRRECENTILQAYYDELQMILKGKGMENNNYTMETLKSEYINGGIGRWAWFIPFFSSSPSMAQYFHDQLSEFLKDHIQDPNDMPMPRV
jgi:hypothetical protein